jgi:hypothetical protein
MFRRHLALVALCCVSTVGLLGACSEDTKATPQAIFEGNLTRGAGTNCQDSAALFTVGVFGEPALKEGSQPKKDGDAQGQGKVAIACSVTGAGAGAFNVDATLNMTGPEGGLFHVDGKFTTTGVQQDIHAIFSSRATTNTYEQLDRKCTVTYDTTYEGVALGRVWGRIDCPNATLSGVPDTTCTASATFRFENCAQ